MIKRIIVALAFVGAAVFGTAPATATPLAGGAALATHAEAGQNVDKVQYRYYAPRRHFRHRYYAPRRYYRYPRYYSRPYVYHRPVYRPYRYYYR